MIHTCERLSLRLSIRGAHSAPTLSLTSSSSRTRLCSSSLISSSTSFSLFGGGGPSASRAVAVAWDMALFASSISLVKWATNASYTL